ncbi:MAG: AAA family ATPase, partial [Planctomycetes bacterium]|nr:AAA family ATPase [Planctomycetota bacterium]
MIQHISIANVASYGLPEQSLSNLAKINFVYGSNATGKTTISRVIADSEAHPECKVTWQGGTALEAMVYNRDFIEKNFNQTDELKGIFTLGEKDKSTLDKIKAAKSDFDSITASIATLKSTLEGEDDNGGKIAELKQLETEFEKKCWELKLKHDARLQGAFAGLRNNKSNFKAELLEESTRNTSKSAPLADLENKAETVFGETPQTEPTLTVPSYEKLLDHEANSILKKKVIGKSDVDIAAMIQKLGNSDWVKQGRAFYDPEEQVCPFCQKPTDASLEESLNEYFDEAFEKDSAAIEKLYTNYKSDSERFQESLQKLLDSPSKRLDSEKLQAESDLLDSKIRINIQRIEEKQRESSKSIELDSLKNILEAVKTLLEAANTAIQEHNTMVTNLATERKKLRGQVWRYLLDHEIKSDLATYNSEKNGLGKAIANLEQQIKDKTEEKHKKKQEIRTPLSSLDRNFEARGENFVGSSIAEAFSRTVVEKLLDFGKTMI